MDQQQEKVARRPVLSWEEHETASWSPTMGGSVYGYGFTFKATVRDMTPSWFNNSNLWRWELEFETAVVLRDSMGEIRRNITTKVEGWAATLEQGKQLAQETLDRLYKAFTP